ncbi:MAG: hypothetical protein EA427_14495 [Spirochaetaceae bacterium]|nr:MAG: hypothetical protein EA427_14495 [Spirochaetaceae bacterium]
MAAITVLAMPVQAQEEGLPAGVDGRVVLQNVAREGWRVISIEGEGVFTGGAATVYLEVNGRYQFDLSGIDSEHLPLDFRGLGGRVLFSQSPEEGPEPDLDGLDLQVDEEGVTFTLTEALAEELSFFRATPYPQMTGIVAPFSEPDAAEDAEDAEDAEEEA